MFGAQDGFFVQEIEAQGVFVVFHLAQEAVAELDPFFLADLAFEHGFLDAGAVIFAGLGHAPQTSASGGFDGGDIVSHQH